MGVEGWNNIMSLGNCLIFLQRAQRGIRKQTASAPLKDEEGKQSLHNSLSIIKHMFKSYWFSFGC